MNQSETCPKCGQEKCNDNKKYSSGPIACNRCGYVFTIVIEEEPKEILEQKDTGNLYTLIAVLLSTIGSVIVIGDYLYGVPKILAIFCYLSLAILYVLLAGKYSILEAKGQVVLFGTFSLIFLVAALFRWAGFQFGPFILELLIRIAG